MSRIVPNNRNARTSPLEGLRDLIALSAVGTIASVALAAGYSTPAHAGVFVYSGVSEFSQPCALCDTTVNFSVYENTDGDWTNDLFFSGVARTALADLSGKFAATVNSAARYVYMYQVVNTDQTPTAGIADSPIRNFNIAIQDSGLVNGAGFFSAVFKDNAGVAVDGTNYSLLSPDYVFGSGNTIVDDGLVSSLSGLAQPSGLESNASFKNPVDVRTGLPMSNTGPNAAFNGDSVIFEWGAGVAELNAGETSGVLFLTSDRYPTIRWAETESVGGTGAGNDVPVPAPEPTTLGVLGMALAGLGWIRRRRSN